MPDTAPTAPIVEMRGIDKSFGAVRALSGVDLVLYPGEILGLVGDNSAGKSTLMKILTGAYQRDAGEILVAGQPVHFKSPHESRDVGIEMIYQDFALCGNMDVGQNIFLGRWPRRGLFVDRGRMYREADSVLKRLKVDVNSVYQKVESLSGGRQQSVAIARAISFEPRVVILDEPTANLSVMATERLLETMLELKRQGVAQIIISHRLVDIFAVGDRVMVLKRGENVGDRHIRDTDEHEVLEIIVSGTRTPPRRAGEAQRSSERLLPPGESGRDTAPRFGSREVQACPERRNADGTTEIAVVIEAADRLDKALAAAVPEAAGLSRSRLQALIAEGAVADAAGVVLNDPRVKLAPGTEVVVRLPPPRPIRAAAEAIPLDIVFEDADLLVIDKPAGLVVHPAPGAAQGTLVNALLHHCGGTLSGIGGRLRPGIVHRIDKDTSGLLVVAKSDAAHRGLARQFAAHDLERRYLAVTHGAPDPADPRLAHLAGISWEPGGDPPGRGADRAASRRPQADGGAERDRQAGGDPGAGAGAVRAGGGPGGGAGGVPPRDRAHASESACTWPLPGIRWWGTPSTAAAGPRARSAAFRARRCTRRASASPIRSAARRCASTRPSPRTCRRCSRPCAIVTKRRCATNRSSPIIEGRMMRRVGLRWKGCHWLTTGCRRRRPSRG